ncbi:DsbA family protein [Sphingomonas edaphi]|uniref:DsbA family protein n=1 Tax=Sphingomonas edaphi TaxID=2315689 RepID=A0A418PZ68_9SPHN|nr:DsbA family protein [Sphingomonas edaphi]RIX27434.1 DsbA family protein [Sphingomonas edaphi]
MKKTLLALLFLSTASVATVMQGGATQSAPTPSPAAPAAPKLTREMFTEDKLAPTVKPPAYDITIVEYTDYQCPFCRKVHPELKRLAAADRKVRIIYRDWPIFGDASVAAARVAIASQWQGKHAAVHDALMNTPRPMDEAAIKSAATKAGVNWSRLQADMKTRKAEIDALLERNNEQAEALGLQGTPAFLVGNYLVEGGLDYEGLKAAVHKARTTPNPDLTPSSQPAGI